ncbi:MAG TPA: hypothetical protein V6D05_06610 [Stenomitos sp.]
MSRPGSPFTAPVPRPWGRNLASYALLATLGAAALAAPAQAVPWYSVGARADIGNQPRAAFEPDLNPLSALNLAQTQLMGRLPLVELRVGEAVSKDVDIVLSGALRQDIEQPLANPELYDAYRSRVRWRQAGGVGLTPLYVAQIEDAYLQVRDPVRQGFLQVGQFNVPFGNEGYAASSPPVAIAPAETPMTEYLTSVGPDVYQNSTQVRWRDIGMVLSGRAGSYPYAFGVFNGAGPNRLDDNGDKDWFARLDWQASETDLLGVSALWGRDQVFPAGFAGSGVTVDRRRYGVHWRFKAGDASVLGEWARETREGLDPAPRDGYVLEASQTLGSNDLFYVAYSQYFDPNAQPSRGYLIREAAVGDVRPLMANLRLRLELRYFWEFSGSQSDNYGRYLTSIETTIGGPPAAENLRQNFPGSNVETLPRQP